MKIERLRSFTMSVPWNLFLLTISGVLSSFALCSIAVPHSFVSGGIYGTAMLIVFASDSMSIAFWYFLFNIPILILGWVFLSKRFLLYTLYCIVITTLATQFIPWTDVGIHDKMLAAFATGICCGVGAGFALRSLGSDGGLNIISLILHHKFNFSVGSFSIVYNSIFFLLATPIISIDNVLYSIIISYITSSIMNYSMGIFNNRKMVIIISDKYDAISQSVLRHLGRGCTLLHGQGAFTHRDREVILTVVHDIQLKRLEEIVFNEDPVAFVIIENTNRVLGKGFSQRKVY